MAYDAIVVGGGIVGAHCALQLRRAGLREVLVLERDSPASKASGRAAGSLTVYSQERFGAAASRFGREFYERLAAEREEFTLHRGDSYSIAYTEEGAENLRHEHSSLSIDTELLSAAELGERAPVFATADVTAALRFENGVYTDPHQLTMGVHAAAAERGVALRTEAVTGLARGEPWLVETTEDSYETPVVVVAAGAWSKRLLGHAGVDIALIPRTSQIAILDPPREIDVPSWGAPDFSVYGRPTTEGRVLFGGGVGTPIEDLDGFRTRARVPFLREVGEYAPVVMPALEEATLHDDWAGRVSATPDLAPHIGETRREGLYVCAGFNGEGVSNSAFGGRLLADLVTGSEPITDPSQFDPTRYDGDEQFRVGNAVEWSADR